MQTIFTLNKLSIDFYTDYSSVQYPEIEFKPSRPYVVMVVEIDGNKFALPLRTNIRHDYCYKFKNTGRSTNSATGIDFTKAVIVNDAKYIGEATTIDNKEYVELFTENQRQANGTERLRKDKRRMRRKASRADKNNESGNR